MKSNKSKRNINNTKSKEVYNWHWWNRKPNNDIEYMTKVLLYPLIITCVLLIITLGVRDTRPGNLHDSSLSSKVVVTYYGFPNYHFVCIDDKCAIDEDGLYYNFVVYFMPIVGLFIVGFGNYGKE